MPKYTIIMSTEINTPIDSHHVSLAVAAFPSILEWSVDLEDRDKILRLVCNDPIGAELVKMLEEKGVSSAVLEIFDENGVSI